MSYEMTGTVKKIMDLMTFDSGFTKREFVVTTKDQYPQDVKFETVRDKTSLCDKMQEGQEVTVHFDVRGNEFKDRYYVNLNAWRVESGAGTAAAAPAAQDAPLDTDLPDSAAEDEEDYPF
ncbi:DUF3127 domain-containing protein [Kiritimatiellota bacterium B12222]|nr:DUF3127 domain-containing protein [Kiritimatiellota bacterium B12222]